MQKIGEKRGTERQFSPPALSHTSPGFLCPPQDEKKIKEKGKIGWGVGGKLIFF
nr:hypothetical protein [uncultured Blautia sp.]